MTATFASSAPATARNTSTHAGPDAPVLFPDLVKARIRAGAESFTDRVLGCWDTLTRALTRTPFHDGPAHVQATLSCGAHAVIRAKNTPVGPIAVLAITGADGEIFTRRFKAGTGASAQSARLDALTFLTYRLGNPWYSLYIDDTELRHHLNAHRPSFPTFDLAPAPHPGSDQEANHALNGSNKPAHTATTHGLDHIIIATDASVAVNGTPGAGLGWAASDGTTGTRYMPGTADIGWAELNAIHHALLASTSHRSVIILSDNRHAVAIATGNKHPRDRDLAAAITALTTGRNVTIEWIRAHNGHPLNETADTLATTTRHTHQHPTTTKTATARKTRTLTTTTA